jgi:hypothetical protein
MGCCCTFQVVHCCETACADDLSGSSALNSQYVVCWLLWMLRCLVMAYGGVAVSEGNRGLSVVAVEWILQMFVDCEVVLLLTVESMFVLPCHTFAALPRHPLRWTHEAWAWPREPVVLPATAGGGGVSASRAGATLCSGLHAGVLNAATPVRSAPCLVVVAHGPPECR